MEASPASPSKLLRLKILLDDINNNRRRIQEIFQRIDDAQDNEEDIWKIWYTKRLDKNWTRNTFSTNSPGRFTLHVRKAVTRIKYCQC